MAIPQPIFDIIQKRLAGQLLTREEQLQLKQWFASGDADNNLFEQKDWDRDILKYVSIHLDQKQQDQALQRFMSAAGFSDQNIPDRNIDEDMETPSITSHPTHRIHFLKTRWLRYAAAIIIIAGAAALLRVFTYKHSGSPTVTSVPASDRDIEPGGNKAILTLSDGTAITLDSAANGAIAQQGNSSIIKKADGEIIYNVKGLSQNKVMMNTMTTPRGGQYQITLPDGTKVWMNAASSIIYPTAFAGKTRDIQVTGEVYLEVFHNPKQPFSINVNGAKLEVLGTSFNVNAYGDENALKTTLISGRMRVSTGDAGTRRGAFPNAGSSVILRPGQQAVIANRNSESIQVQFADTDQVLAWKNGIFNFQDADLKALMHQIERWYNVEVKYEGAIPDIQFRGKVDMGVKLSGIIRFLSNLGVKARIEDRTLIIEGK